jgi:hypothetical protein
MVRMVPQFEPMSADTQEDHSESDPQEEAIEGVTYHPETEGATYHPELDTLHLEGSNYQQGPQGTTHQL